MKGEGLTHQQRIERGRRAAEMLKDEVFLEAVDEARQSVVNRFLGANDFDQTRALAAFATNKALDTILEDLRRTMHDGQIASQPPRKRL